MRCFLLSFLLSLAFFFPEGMAQKPLSKKGGFLFPIQPGKPASLTGNMGELRSNHFHGGLDIRTGWASGLPVLAIKDGYVSRVSFAGEGYGNTVFITHPDGFVSVYAHLESLKDPLHTYIKKQQYEQRRFDVDILLKKDLFRVKQGDTIAISGNTGSSRGPHLHFEIRDTSGMVYNPLSFGFSEVVDKLSPTVDRLALVPLETQARVNGKFERTEILVREAGKEFLSIGVPEVYGTVGLEIKARDRLSNGTSNGGVFCIEMYLNGQQVYYHNMYQFPMAKTNHINQLINYRHFRLTAEKFQKLYAPDGYFQTRNMKADAYGKIRLPEGAAGNLEIVLWDVAGNKRVCKVRLKGGESPDVVQARTGPKASRLQYEIFENTLYLQANGETGARPELELLFKGKARILHAAYREGNNLVFLHDLRTGLPDSLRSEFGLRQKFSFAGMLAPGQPHNLSLSGVGVTLRESVLFDTLYLDTNLEGTDVRRINTSLTPLADYMTLSLPAPVCRSAEGPKHRAYAEALSGVFNKSLSSECQNGNLFFNTKYLGKFKIQKDSTPPKIKVGVCNASWARFEVYDNLSGIDTFEATLNGQFVLMVMDRKRHLLYADPWPSQLPMRGDFELKVTDKSGNTSIFTKKL